MIRLWDASTGTVLSHPQIAADDAPRLALDKLTIGRWLPNIDTGRYMGALPVGVNFHCWQVHGFTCVAWTAGFKLVLIHFPEY